MKAVEVVNVSKKFGALAALSNVNMYVDTGEIVGLIGPNGAGKTTLFNILTGFLKPDTGVVKIFGDDVTNLPPHKIAQKKVARSFQIIKPFPSMTVLESVMVGGYPEHKRRENSAGKSCRGIKDGGRTPLKRQVGEGA
jgi:branched-chain amino acid transport system ATP-binding protein